MSIRITGLIMVILGGISSGLPNRETLVIFHILIGFILVFLLWWLVYRAARAGVSIVLVGIATARRPRSPPGIPAGAAYIRAGPSGIHVVHLLAGLGALALAEILAGTDETPHTGQREEEQRPENRRDLTSTPPILGRGRGR